MTPIRAVKNQYIGINAHLHSYWQKQGGWNEFHTSYIADLNKGLKAHLLPMGYTTGIERSLQIRRSDDTIMKPRSDVTIYDTDPTRPYRQPGKPIVTAATLSLPDAISLEFEEMLEYRALAIYDYVPGKDERGKAVAWIEILSPSNKPGGQDAVYYRNRRLELLQSGIVFVEVDYLHESPPTFDGIPWYGTIGKNQTPEPDAHPYLISVVDPRPNLTEGQVHPYYFDVDTAIPTVSIPLNADDVLQFDFGLPYDKTISEALFAYELIDYSQPPLNFDRYSLDDQIRILARMIAVLKAKKSGRDLDQDAPFPTDSLGLDDAFNELERWR